MNAASRLALHLALAAAAGYAGAAYHLLAHPAPARQSPSGSIVRTALAAPGRTSGSTATQGTVRAIGMGHRDAAARAAASVVTVYCATAVPAGPRPPSPVLAIASGVVVDREGLVVTTSELAAVPGGLVVVLPDGTRRPARLLGSDPAAGLALLKVDGTALEPIDIAEPGSAAVGDTVLALGDAFGVGLTVTQGIISAVRPAELGGSAPSDFIQTDAAIHSGNFGGALVDVAGRLVGITLGKVGDETGAGLAFAVPAERVVRVSAQLRLATRGESARPPQTHERGRFTEISDRHPLPDTTWRSPVRARRVAAARPMS